MKKKKNNKNFILKHRYIISVCFMVFGVFILPHIPYVNLLFTYLNIIILFPAVIFLLGFNGRNLLKAGIVLFALMLITTLLDKSNIADSAGNLAYFVLFLGIVLLIRDMIKKE
jgi:hypothetical protein